MTINSVLLFSVIYLLIFAMCYFSVICETEKRQLKPKKSDVTMGAVCLGLLLLGQFVVACYAPGHVQDTGLFRAWAAFAQDHPVWEYYATELYVDYPPVYLYVLYFLGKLGQLLGIDTMSGLYLGLIRSVPILFDGLTVLLVYRLAQPRIGQNKALAVAALCAVNPAHILNSSIWGQVDSVTTLLAALMLLFLYRREYAKSFGMLALLFLTKPQMILFSPLLGFTYLFDLLSEKENQEARSRLLKQGVLSFGVAVLVLLIVPLLATGGNYMILLENYKKALNLYPYATLNAPNLYGLLGQNWTADAEKLLLLSYKTWGFLFIVLLSLYVGYVSFRQKDRSRIFYLGALLVLGIYLFGHGMHERYSYPALLLIVMLYLFTGDKRQLWFYGGFSLSTFVICSYVLVLNLQGEFIYGDNVLFRILSLVNLVLLGLWIYTSLHPKTEAVPVRQKVVAPKKTVPEKLPLRRGPIAETPFLRLDYILMTGLTLFYALFGFYHLGSRQVPETGWYPEYAQESVIMDLGETLPAEQMYVYTGWIDRRYSDQEVHRLITVETSLDGINWQQQPALELDTIFMWYPYREFLGEFRYVRLTCDDGRFYLNEAAFFGADETRRYPIVATISENPTASLLCDEPEKVTYEFSWFETTYFDEIYYPRTAYENITHRYPYENTHPPLGKAIIACGMLLFGVNPFGWRFFGTLCGVLMVPLAYVLGKKMLKKTSLAFLVAFLMSFDFMHLSQTRIGTIDSYTAFFVMGMYLFMFLYLEKSAGYASTRKQMLPLLASGICFGLGAATKWQGIYGGVGLAVLYFYNLSCRYGEFRRAKERLQEDGAKEIVEGFPKLLKNSILAGFGFFVLIPAVIYFLSYIPAMMTESTGLSFFFTNQKSMYDYHSSLEAGHSYSSTWLQWLFDYKPLYAYSPNRDFVPEGMSMGITSFGNPAIWWMTIPALVFGILRLWKTKRQPDLGLLTAVVGFFSLYAPWIFVTRTAFIYHFFPCVIFVILILGFIFREKVEENPKWRYGAWGYMALCFVLFLAFYPVLTGMMVPTAYVELLRWVPGWVLG